MSCFLFTVHACVKFSPILAQQQLLGARKHEGGGEKGIRQTRGEKRETGEQKNLAGDWKLKEFFKKKEEEAAAAAGRKGVGVYGVFSPPASLLAVRCVGEGAAKDEVQCERQEGADKSGLSEQCRVRLCTSSLFLTAIPEASVLGREGEWCGGGAHQGRTQAVNVQGEGRQEVGNGCLRFVVWTDTACAHPIDTDLLHPDPRPLLGSPDDHGFVHGGWEQTERLLHPYACRGRQRHWAYT